MDIFVLLNDDIKYLVMKELNLNTNISICKDARLQNRIICQHDSPIYKYIIKRYNIDVNNLILKAAIENNVDLILIAMKFGAKYNTALTVASRENYDIVKLLLENGADPNNHTPLVWSPLMEAIINGKTEIAKLLIEYDANVNFKNVHGESPLFEAVDNNRIEIIQMLLNNGANINITDNNGWTSIMAAARDNKIRIVELLLRNNANPISRNFYGQSALSLTDSYYIRKIIKEKMK